MPSPSPQQLAYCITQVTRFIPSPTPPKVKEQKSKFGLKVGQLLGTPAGEVFKVGGVDNLGLTLETPDGKCARLTNRDELAHYTKVRATKAPKAKKTPSGKRKALQGGN